MRESTVIAKRMRDMLTHDKIGIKEGFSTALENDIEGMLSNYFQLENQPKIHIVQQDDGMYGISIDATASRIKQFESTLDARRF